VSASPAFWRDYARSAVELSGGTMEIDVIVPDEEAAALAGSEIPPGGPVRIRVAPGEWRAES